MGNSESQQFLNKVQNEFGYTFKNQELLKQCLTHDSLRADNPNIPTYQRLEFLGDTVLQFIITEYLFNKFPQVQFYTIPIQLPVQIIKFCQKFYVIL